MLQLTYTFNCYFLKYIIYYSLVMLFCSYFSYLSKFHTFSDTQKKYVPFRFMNDHSIVNEWWTIQFGHKLTPRVTRKPNQEKKNYLVNKSQRYNAVTWFIHKIILFHSILWVTELILDFNICQTFLSRACQLWLQSDTDKYQICIFSDHVKTGI